MEPKPLREFFFLLDFPAYFPCEALPNLRELHNVGNIRGEKQTDQCRRKHRFLPGRSEGNFQDESQQEHICAPNDCRDFVSDDIRMERTFLRSLVHLRGPIADCFLVLLVVLVGVHEDGAILGEPGQLVKFLRPAGSSRSSQPLKSDGQTFGPLPSPESNWQQPFAIEVRSNRSTHVRSL